MASLDLSVGDYVPADRLYAVENGPSGFDPSAPQHQPKIKLLMLMRNEALVRLLTRYLDESSTLVVEIDGRVALRADLSSPEGRLAFEALLRRAVPGELRGAPKVLTARPGFRFTDSPRGYVSILNFASMQAIEGLLGRAVDPLRFRANVAVTGLEPWAEFDLVGREILAPSGLVLVGTKRIVRCAATTSTPSRASATSRFRPCWPGMWSTWIAASMPRSGSPER